MKILITGAAGFIGGNLIKRLEDLGLEVFGIDNYSPYYSIGMKKSHVNSLKLKSNIETIDICDSKAVKEVFLKFKPDQVVHLAAQGGVRASKTNPIPYLETNQIGFLNVLTATEEAGAGKFIYASSSSIYGDGLEAPFSELDLPFSPKSLYALSKTSNELVAKYLPLRDTQRIGLRFFTVYGPWGRPDMAIFRILASSILNEEFVYTANDSLKRDFTYVDDVSKVISELISSSTGFTDSQIFNVAGGNPYTFSQMFSIMEEFGVKPKMVVKSQDSLDVNITHASTIKLMNSGIRIPDTTLRVGIQNTLNWMSGVDKNNLREWYEYSK